jgi:tRNA threonylcarbamoyladenosine biosynthesis protein TsaE
VAEKIRNGAQGGIASAAKSVVTRSAEETIAWGREFARGLSAPLLVLLTGDLGSGKTTLTKGIVAGLGAAEEEDVTSPTFTLVHVYGDEGADSGSVTPSSSRADPSPTSYSSKSVVYHGDLYRIESFHDFETLGLEDAFAKPAVMILEWSEKFPLQAPWPQVRLKLEHMGGDSRRITVG